MSGYNQDPRYGGQPETYWGDQTQQASSINFDMSGNNFGQELDFQSFDAQPPPEGSYAGAPLYGSNPYLNPSGNVSRYHGDIFTPPASGNAQPGFVEKGGEFEEEPPLLEGKTDLMGFMYIHLEVSVVDPCGKMPDLPQIWVYLAKIWTSSGQI
uniref:Uncharacterized protein n=1 Tax=Timema monikensis TaxID=170555 RepID=A0A7R9E3M8_9NEOP|nr:unnamed protein product [Timema monikensis]